MSKEQTKKVPEPKDKVIHTRVPDTLDEELKTRASNLGISVSNLVRNILGNAFDLFGDVIVDSTNIGRAVSGPIATPDTDPVLGWHKLILNVNAVCSECNKILPKGEEAAAAVTPKGAGASFLCLNCLKEI